MKQVTPVGPSGESLFDYAVYDAARTGFDEVVFVVSEESRGPVERHAESGCGRHVGVRFVVQAVEAGRAKPWGTGQAVLCGSAGLSGPFGVVNADDFYGPRSFELLGRELAAEGPDHVLVAFLLRESLSAHGGVSRGVCEVEDGLLSTITELHEVRADPAAGGVLRCREGMPLTGDELISANLWGFRPSFRRVLSAEFERFLAAHGDDGDAEFLLGDAVERLPRHGRARVRVVATPERFLGMTYAPDVADVSEAIAGQVAVGRYPSPLWP